MERMLGAVFEREEKPSSRKFPEDGHYEEGGGN